MGRRINVCVGGCLGSRACGAVPQRRLLIMCRHCPRRLTASGRVSSFRRAGLATSGCVVSGGPLQEVVGFVTAHLDGAAVSCDEQ